MYGHAARAPCAPALIVEDVARATRFYRDLRKNAGLVYFVSSDFQVGLTRGVYQISYACDPPNVFKARNLIVRDLDQMRTNNVSDEELHQARVLLLRKIPLSEASFDDIAGGWLSRSRSRARSWRSCSP